MLIRYVLLLPFLGLLLVGCGADVKPNPTAPGYMTEPGAAVTQGPGLFGDQGIVFGTSKTKQDQTGGGGLGVNAYLWRGALDTLSFMPLQSADPFGGVIITDW